MGNRLLLADDSITIQKVVAIIFANEEFELTVVDNGISALEKAREIRPDVMLVDAVMPGKSGYEVCAEIRRDPALCSVPILLLIGAFEPPDEEKANSCGADAVISKPFESQQLIDRVNEMLELGKTRSVISAPKPPAIESAAEELWGDLSSFDTTPPVAAPTIPAAPAPTPYSPPAAFVEEIVEASYEDDLWGAFDLDELPKAEAPVAGGFSAGSEPEPEAEAEFEAVEVFSFDDESEAIEETGPALESAQAPEETVEEPIALKSDEELFSFADDLSFNAPPEMEPFVLPEYEPISFVPEDEPEFAAEAVKPDAFAPVNAPIPDLEPQSTPFFQPAGAVGAGTQAQPAAPALSEADLVAALSRISKEVIERIVWEVVPDLAEALIKEEIRKLKAGIRG
jgi:CheY-like chemotaxis protein